jgi:alkanesulfonate monooxygenase SsuD/methylene tetrahydromethanopterin reductase-like flavin-dependent oxidoreductase (luciferase family)
MKVGVVAPVFARSTGLALSVAQAADESGLDGVFSYDHLFPIRSPHRPALSAIPMLAAMAVTTERVHIGTLVSRVTLLPPAVLVAELVRLDEISGHRLIAGLGAGDSLTTPENDAYGLPFPKLTERVRLLGEVSAALRARGVTTWIGGRSPQVRDLAAAQSDAWNAWGGPLDELTAFAATNQGGAQATWGGPPPEGDVDAFRRHLRGLAEARIEWAVYGPPPTADWDALVPKLAEAAKAVR